MTTDLWMLVASAGLAWVQIMVPANRNLLVHGMGWALGNREDSKSESALSARAKRASANMQENLPLFAILVLVAHVSGTAGDLSALGAIVFFAARCAHFLIYVAGIPHVRTLVWATSIVGMGMIVVDIVR